MNTTILSGAIFTGMLKQGSLNLKSNKTIVNDLNVFPIPDGDTGDNMYMTISSGCASLSKEPSDSLCKISSSAAGGMLFGARGNSGVILSRIFAGIAKGFEGLEEADVAQMGKAFEEGVRSSYGAVTTPVEGTILTVFRESVECANSKITDGSTLESYFDDFTKEIRESLKRTPDLLDVLKEAGVVDSGGAGFLYIAEGMKNFLAGKITAEEQPEEKQEAPSEVIDLNTFGPDSELEFGYCTEFLLRLQNAKTDPDSFDLDSFVKYLNDIGNSVVAFRDGSIVKVHVHTFHPGTVLEHCRNFGEFLTVKIENMTLQHHNSTVRNRFDEESEPSAEETEKSNEDTSFLRRDVRKKYGVVTVAAGEGIKEMFSEICVDQVVDGGQSMNPSAEDLVNAFKKVNADTIFVLPNNGNIILTAKQAAELYKDSDVRVIKTRSIGEGYAVVSMMDLSPDTPEEIIEAAKEAMDGVVTGMVSTATRTTEMDGIKITAGDYLGFDDDKVYYSGKSKTDAVLKIAEEVGADDKAVLIVIKGLGATDEEAEEVLNRLNELYTDVEIIPMDGKQPIYDFMLVFE